MKMKYAIYVKGERGRRCLIALVKKNLCPILCISEQEDNEVSQLCLRYKIFYQVENRPKSSEHIKFVNSYKLDLLVCAGYSKILPVELFHDLPLGGINLHGGKLPEYRGASPIPWQIINGEKEGVAYILKLTEGVDDGPILAREKYVIDADDTARDVTDKVLAIFERILPEIVGKYSKGIIPKGVKQKERHACHWTRRYPEDGLIDWNGLKMDQVVNLVRALDSPYPGAYIVYNKEKIIISKVRVYKTRMSGVPGRFVGLSKDGALILALDGAVEVLQFKYRNKSSSGRKFPAKYGYTF